MMKFKSFLEQLEEKFSSNSQNSLQYDPNGFLSTNRFYNNRFESQIQNRSIRQIEEQMSSLRKENFNLKLRIYFLEEKIPELNKMDLAEGEESLMKQFLDNKIETEMLKIDLQDKQQLLIEAGEALTHMENIQKDTEKRYEQLIDELNHKIQYLEFEKYSLEKCSKNEENIINELIDKHNIDGNKIDIVKKVRELKESVKDAETKITNLNKQNINLEQIVLEKNKLINQYEESIKQNDFQQKQLIEQLKLKEECLTNIEVSK
ncbi:centrosomin-like [Condylostylus longicornis]|uniref:centrosomin-like n=1 Tax=Condylostylus longicornis TaxID=2530218 RepID=UPI00244DA2D9|nr:centrosomin-like [Condylostylus longicornis]